MKIMYRVTCGRVQWFNELLGSVTQQASHAVDDSHWFTLARKKQIMLTTSLTFKNEDNTDLGGQTIVTVTETVITNKVGRLLVLWF